MVMKMNKKDIKNKLIEKTNYNEEQCDIINEIINKHFIIGKNNKEKIKEDFISNLKISEREADNLYNICAEIIMKGMFRKE